ncbi:unnamed protein product [Prunus armeniaca]
MGFRFPGIVNAKKSLKYSASSKTLEIPKGHFAVYVGKNPKKGFDAQRVWLLFTLLHIANLTSLLSSLREILENLYCLSKRGVAVHPKLWWGMFAQMDQLLPIIAGLGWSMLGLVRCRPRQLSGYPEEVGGLPPAQDIERWKHNGPDLDDLLAGQDECFAGLPLRRLKKLASARIPLEGLRACSAHPLGWFPLGNWRVPGPPLRGSGRVLHIP